MQEELGRLWEELRFTLLFVTHSIEEALVVGNRILLLSPHPGQVRAELNSHQFGLHSAGSEEFQAAAQRIHGLLFGTAPSRDASAGPAATAASLLDRHRIGAPATPSPDRGDAPPASAADRDRSATL